MMRKVQKWMVICVGWIVGLFVCFAFLSTCYLYILTIVLNDGFEDHVLSKPMSKWESEVLDVYVIDRETILVEVKEDGEKTLYYATYHGYLSEFVISPEYILKTDPTPENAYTFTYSAWRNKWRLHPNRGSPVFDEYQEITLKRRRQKLENEEIPIFLDGE